MIKNYEHEHEARYSIAKTLGKIGGARAVRALTNPEFFGSHAKWWEYGDVAPDIFGALGKINDVSVISVLLKALEEVNKKTPGHRRCHQSCYHCKHFSIEELGMTEYYANDLLKEIPSKPTFRKKYKIYGIVAQRASVAIVKILSKFEKSIMKNYTNDDTDLESLLMGEPIERKWIAVILQKIADKNLKSDEKKNVLKFLKSDDQGMVIMGASMLKGAMK